MNQLVVDVETKKLFSEISSRNPADLGVSYVGALMVDESGNYESGSYVGFFENEISGLWPIMEKADRIIGFNVIEFDLPALSVYYQGDFSRFSVLDIMAEIEKVVSHRISLQAVATATLNEGKSADGLSAVRYWREGRLDELAKYCRQDVEVTAKVFEYGVKNGHLIFKNKWNEEKKVGVDFGKSDEKPKIQMTLGLS
jgi:DEAD/DEAH box helicase domain-containing protein